MTRKTLITRIGLGVLALTVVTVGALLVIRRNAAAEIEATRVAGERIGLTTQLTEIEAQLDATYGVIGNAENAAPLFTAAVGLLPDDDTFETAQDSPLGEVDPALRARVAEAAPAFEMIARAAELPRCRYPARWEDGIAVRMPEIQGTLRLRAALRARASIRLADEDLDGALEDARLMGAVAESLREQPTLIAQMVRIAVGQTADDVLRAVLPRHPEPLAAWRRRAPPSPRGAVLLGLRGEFTLASSVLGDVIEGNTEAFGSDASSIWMRLAWPFAAGGSGELLSAYADMVAHGDAGYPALLARAAERDAELQTTGLFGKMFAIGLENLVRREAETLTRRAVTEAGARLLQKQIEKGGALPQSLDAIPDIPTDPRTESALTLRIEDGNAVLSGADDVGVWKITRPAEKRR